MSNNAPDYEDNLFFEPEKPKVDGLPLGDYYIKLWGGEVTTDTWDIDGWQYFNKKGDEVVEVIAPVPTYEEYKNLLSKSIALEELDEMFANEQENNADLQEENAKLKELLKECVTYVNRRFIETKEHLNKPYTASTKALHKKAEKLLTKIDEVLK